jgi:hypothetical protein
MLGRRRLSGRAKAVWKTLTITHRGFILPG